MTELLQSPPLKNFFCTNLVSAHLRNQTRKFTDYYSLTPSTESLDHAMNNVNSQSPQRHNIVIVLNRCNHVLVITALIALQ